MLKTYLLFFLLSVFLVADTLDITFLDVKEGESIFIKTPNNRHILIDCGNPKEAGAVIDFLQKKQISSLDALILTHPHLDHMGGVFQLLDTVKVKQKYDNGADLSNKGDIYRWYLSFYRQANYSSLSAGDTLHFEGTKIQILSPQKLSGNWNKDSLVLEIQYKQTNILLMADATIPVEKTLINNHKDLKSDLLKVGHHGYKDATSKGFLQHVQPRFAVISIDKDNIRNYPSQEVLDRLEEQDVELFKTYIDGTVSFTSDGKKLKTPF